LVLAIGERYGAAAAHEKSRILDEFVALTGHHRKHAIRVLNGREPPPAATERARPRVYDDAVREALVILWEASDRICGKRLKPLLPVLVPALERHGHLKRGSRRARPPARGERVDDRQDARGASRSGGPSTNSREDCARRTTQHSGSHVR